MTALSDAAVLALHAEGLDCDAIAKRLGVPFVVACEWYFLRSMRPHPAPYVTRATTRTRPANVAAGLERERLRKQRRRALDRAAREARR